MAQVAEGEHLTGTTMARVFYASEVDLDRTGFELVREGREKLIVFVCECGECFDKDVWHCSRKLRRRKQALSPR